MKHPQSYRHAARGSAFDHVTHEVAADSSALELRDECHVGEIDVVRMVNDNEVAGWLVIHLHDSRVGLAISCDTNGACTASSQPQICSM